jgi:dihydrolipoamide dehydrogenase
VVGSGAIGIEFASFFHTMGADVTVVEVLPQILPVEDAEIATLARKRFEKQGIKILTSTKVTKLEKKTDSVVATIDDGKGKPQAVEFDRVISAVGVVLWFAFSRVGGSSGEIVRTVPATTPRGATPAMA